MFEKVHWFSAVDNDGLNRRTDIIVIERSKDRSIILDPKNSLGNKVGEKRKSIYEPCILWLSINMVPQVGKYLDVGLELGFQPRDSYNHSSDHSILLLKIKPK